MISNLPALFFEYLVLLQWFYSQKPPLVFSSVVPSVNLVMCSLKFNTKALLHYEKNNCEFGFQKLKEAG